MKHLKAGKELVDLVRLCYAADQPVLLVGKHGVGKSELLEQAASEMEIGFIVRDLSLMEPPDLVGMPKLSEGRTRYLPPAFLPSDGKGLLVFEELNRCPNYIRAPCLQLLTARTLNDYVLPPGWLPCAAVNPTEDNYDVQDMDAALLSRFVQVGVRPGRTEWLEWGRSNGVHEKVLTYVEKSAQIFNDQDDKSNPRSWTKVSKILHASDGNLKNKLTQAAISGLVGDVHCTAFVQFFRQKDLPPEDVPDLVLRLCTERDQLPHLVHRWLTEGRTDLLKDTAYVVNLLLQNKEESRAVFQNYPARMRLDDIVAGLPPDLVNGKRFKELWTSFKGEKKEKKK